MVEHVLAAFGLVVLVLLGANVAAAIVLGRRDARTLSPFLDRRHTPERLRDVMPDETAESIREIVTSFAFRRPAGRPGFRVVYAPFVEHRDVEFRSRHLNIRADGIRLNGPDDRNDPHAPGGFHVYLFGGSTTLGYGVKDGDTVSAHLEAALRDAAGETPVRVFNAGRQSYISTMELITLIRWLQEGRRIDLAIFLDGVNDVAHNTPTLRNRSRLSETIEGLWSEVEHVQRRSFAVDQLRALLGQMWGRLPLTALCRRIEHRIAAELGRRRDAPGPGPRQYWSRNFDGARADPDRLSGEVSRLTLRTWDMARGIGRHVGFQTLFVAQPSFYVGMDPDKHLFRIEDEHPNWRALYTQYFARLTRASREADDFLDLSGLFANVDRCPFVDYVHYSPYGNRLIAGALAAALRPRLPAVLRTR